MKKTVLLLLFAALSSHIIKSQSVQKSDLFNEISLQVDTQTFSKSKNMLTIHNESFLYFQYDKEDEVCNVKLVPNPSIKIRLVELAESGDYDIIDSVSRFNDQLYDFKVQFKHLSKSNFLKFRLKCLIDSTWSNYDINLFPVTKTKVRLNIPNDELSVGEEKTFELITNKPGNIKIAPDWSNDPDINYLITESNGQLFVHLFANSTGKKTINISLQTIKPYMADNKPVFDLTPITATFNVKSDGLMYLQVDKTDIIFDEKAKTDGVEIQLDNNRMIQLNKTYYIESNEAMGSTLIGSLLTRNKLSNNKILCLLKIYNYHKQSEGYLYIKEDDASKFITNFNILPKTTIEKIKIMRNGKDWTEDLNVYPGETINVRLEGQSMSRAKFYFDALVALASDSIIKSDNFIEYKLKVPLTISKKIINIYNYNQNTGKNLTVKEYQTARPFDFVSVIYGTTTKKVSTFNEPDIYEKSLKDIKISFAPDKIDGDTKLYGKQYFDIDVKITDKDGNLVDYATVSDLIVCPGTNSPRYSFYDRADCSNLEISLNSKINNAIYNQKDWLRIKMTFKSTKDKYDKDNQSKTIEIILQKRYSFDIDVTFPTGLLIKKFNEKGIGNFSGVSMAVIAQYSFYYKDRINKLKPYKIGAGFIAINAFDFNQVSANRDMGLVILGTVNPVNTGRKLSFPIYLGGGYLLSQKKLFYLIGPGISVSF